MFNQQKAIEESDISDYSLSHLEEDHEAYNKYLGQGNKIINDQEHAKCKAEEDVVAEENGNPYEANEQQIFRRRFKNPDMATCWLNSCLQLVLSAMDQNTSDYLFKFRTWS